MIDCDCNYDDGLCHCGAYADPARNTVLVPDEAIEAMLAQYIETALWSSTDNSDESGGEPLDANYGPDDIDPSARASMRLDCAHFIRLNRAAIGDKYEDAGHDFWLTRNRHGAGFWDRPDQWGGTLRAKALTDSAHAFGSSDLYVGDDGRLYVNH